MTTLGHAGSHKKSSRLRATSFQKLLTAGQIRPYPSKKAAAESQLSQLCQQQSMTDVVKCPGEISIYCVNLHAILHAVQYIRDSIKLVAVDLPLKNPCWPNIWPKHESIATPR
jgi:hypothetical protein